MSPRRRWRMSLVLLGMVAACVRVVQLCEVRDSPRWSVMIGDAGRYHEWARGIAAGDWLGEGTFYQAPLYPYWLACVYSVTGPDAVAARWVQAGVGVLSCLVLAIAGRRFFGARAGWLAGLLLALSPAELFHESLIEKSVLVTLLTSAVLLGFGAALRSPRRFGVWLGTGAAIGLLGLVRENALVLAGLGAAWALGLPRAAGARFDRRSRCAAAMLLLVGVLLPLAPVLVRNRIVGGDWRLTTAQFGPNFYIGNGAGADGTYQELVPEHGTPTHEQSDATAIATEEAGRELTPGEVSVWWTRRTLEEIRNDPARWGELFVQKLALTWTNLELGDSEDQYTAARESQLLGWLTVVFPFAALAGWAGFGLVLLGGRLRRCWVLPGFLVLYSLSVALFYVFARYRLPLVPVLALLTGAGMVRGVTLARRSFGRGRAADPAAAAPRKRSAAARLATGICAGSLASALTAPLVVSPLFSGWPEVSEKRMRSVTEFNLGLRLWEQFAPLAAIEPHLEASTRLYPEYTSAWLYWGYVLDSFQQPERAVDKFERAVVLDPDRVEIRLEVGEMLLKLRRPADAVSHLQRAVELSPDDAHSRFLLGGALYLSGRRAEAVEPLQEGLTRDPDAVPPRRLLATVLTELGRSEEAAAELRELQQRLPPASPEAELIRRRLDVRRSPLRKRGAAAK